MTESIISLLSVICGIIGGNLVVVVYKRFSLGLTGNTVAGVFGSVLLIKSFGRLGFDSTSIVASVEFYGMLLVVNLVISLIGGFLAVLLIKSLRSIMEEKT